MIVTILLKEKETTGSIALGSFAVRRILRIWPLYFAVLGISCLLSLKYPSDYVSPHGMRDLLLLCGNFFVIRNGWKLAAIAPLWSISVEEQFYLAIPLLSRLSGRRVLVIILTGFVVCSYICLFVMRYDKWTVVWPNSLVQFQFFGLGGLIAIQQYTLPWKPGRPTRIALGCATVIIWTMGTFLSTFEPITIFSIALIGAFALFYSVAGIEARIPQSLVYLGKISYGLYVFHELILEHLFRVFRVSQFFNRHLAVGSMVALVLTILCAALSYRFFELPFLKMKQHFERVKTRAV